MELEDSGLEFVVEIEPEPIPVLVGRYRVDQIKACDGVQIFRHVECGTEFVTFDVARVCLCSGPEANPVVLGIRGIDRESFNMGVVIGEKPVVLLF